jgi:phage terminase large subunit-like protein
MLAKNTEWVSQKENKELFQRILEKSNLPFYQYEPYFNRRDGKPGWQWKFLESAGKYKGRIALGSNRIGKSEQGAYEAVLAITGKHPYREFPAKGLGWIVSLDFNMSRDVGLPKFEKFLPKAYATHYNKQDRIWTCEAEDRQWEIHFKSTDQGRAKFQGAEVDWIWFDEEPSKTEIFSECETRLVDRAGIWWMTATPILGTAWLRALCERDNVYSNLRAPIAMWDNPYLPLEEIKGVAESYTTEEERLVRVEGNYIVFGGRPVFRDAIQKLNKRLEEIKEDIPPSEGVLALNAANSKTIFTPTTRSPLRVKEEPEKGTKYTIGCDAATGVGQDFTVFNVLSNRLPFVQVANYRAKCDTVEAARVLNDLGWYYNKAMLVIETNYPGNAVQDIILLTHKYPNVYRQEEHLDANPNVSDRFGIVTTETSKWLLIGGLQEILKHDQLILNCPQTIDEILNFVYKEDKSKTGASEGMNDDEVMSLLMAVRGAKMYPQDPKPRKSKTPMLSADLMQQKALMRKFMEDYDYRRKHGRKVVIV